MKKKRFAFLLPEQNRRSLRIAVSAMAFFAFMLFAGSSSAQKLMQTDVSVAKIEQQVQEMAEIVAQIPSDVANTQKARYYQDYLQYLEAVLNDMQNGDTYAKAATKNRALYPNHPNSGNQQGVKRNSTSDGSNAPAAENGKKQRSMKKKDN